MKKYYILDMNCDCCSYKEARSNLPKGAFDGARCRHCGKMLAPGYGGWRIIGEVRAKGDIDALSLFCR